MLDRMHVLRGSRGAFLAAAVILLVSARPALSQPGVDSDAPEPSPSEPESTGTGARADALTHFGLGTAAEISSDFETARAEFEKAFALDPRSAPVAFHLSLCLYHLGRFEPALTLAQKAIDLGSNEPEVHWIAGNCLIALQKPAEAVAAFEAATRAGPHESRYYLSLGNTLEGLGRLKEAAEAFQRAADQQGEDSLYARFRLATVHLHAGDAAVALAEFQALDKERPDIPGVLEGLGSSYEASGRIEEAAEAFGRAAERSPENPGIALLYAETLASAGDSAKAATELEDLRKSVTPDGILGRRMAALAIRLGRFDDALAILQPMRDREPREPDIRGLLAETYLRQGNRDDARRELEAILSWDPDHLNALVALGALESAAGNYEDAVRFLRRAEKRNRDNPRVLYLLSVAEMERGDTKNATRHIRRVLELQRDDERALFALGRIRERAGDLNGAVEAFHRLLQVDPKNATAMNYVGYMLAEHGIRLEEAVDQIKSALVLEPENGFFIDSLGWAYYQQHRYDLAREALERAVDLTEGDPLVREHLGDTYRALGRSSDALEQYRSALGKDPGNKALQKKIQATGSSLGEQGR